MNLRISPQLRRWLNAGAIVAIPVVGVAVLALALLSVQMDEETETRLREMAYGNLTTEHVEQIRADTEIARSRWEKSGYSDYDIDFKFFGAWCEVSQGDQERSPITLHVRGGKITSTTPDKLGFGTNCPTPAYIETLLPPEAFDTISGFATAHDKCMNMLDVTFDPVYGYATTIERRSAGCSDSMMVYEFSNFKPISP